MSNPPKFFKIDPAFYMKCGVLFGRESSKSFFDLVVADYRLTSSTKHFKVIDDHLIWINSEAHEKFLLTHDHVLACTVDDGQEDIYLTRSDAKIHLYRADGHLLKYLRVIEKGETFTKIKNNIYLEFLI